ncbi:MAG: DUF6056 family protein [Akkermansia muciniphila]
MNCLSIVNKCRIVIFGSLLCLFFGWFYYLNHLFPICSDDYGNMYIFESGTGTLSWTAQRVSSLSSLIRSQCAYYCGWGGRTVSGALLQGCLMFDKEVFNLLNTLVYGATALLICIISVGRFSKRLFLLILLTYWIALPSPGSLAFWLTGSISYLWMATLVCGFLCCLLSHRKPVQILGILLAIPAGNSHEGIVSGVLAALVLYLLLDRKRRGIIFYLSLILFITGFLSNVMAPGTSVRMGTNGLEDQSLMCKIGEAYLRSARARVYCSQWGWESWVSFLWVPLAFALATWGGEEHGNRKKRLVQSLSIGAIMCALLILFAAGSEYPRAYYGVSFAGYIGLSTVLSTKLERIQGELFAGILLILVAVNVSSYSEAHLQITRLSRYEEAIRALTLKAPLVIVPVEYRERLGGRYTETYGKFPDILNPSSKALACYLGVSEVAVFSKEDEIQMVENSANFDGLGVGESRNIGKDSYLLRLESRPAKVKGRRLVVPPPTQLDGFWGIILNEALRARVSDHVGATAFCRKGLYYALIKVQDDTEIEVRYENGNEARYTLVPQ